MSEGIIGKCQMADLPTIKNGSKGMLLTVKFSKQNIKRLFFFGANSITFILPLAVKDVSFHSALPHKPASGFASLINSRYREPIRTAREASRKHIDL